jgi:hypothetical protein
MRKKKCLKKKKRDHQSCCLFDEIQWLLLTTSPHWLAGATRATTFLNFIFFFRFLQEEQKNNLARTNEIPDRRLINKPTPKR